MLRDPLQTEFPGGPGAQGRQPIGPSAFQIKEPRGAPKPPTRAAKWHALAGGQGV
jgi:hypothetical protein